MGAGSRLGLYMRMMTMFRFLMDKRVRLSRKIPILVWLVYLLSPVDLLPDPVLGLGIIDDAVLLGFIMSFIGKSLDDYYRKAKGVQDQVGDGIITDVDYEVHQEDKGSG